jgi:hypothetical protein
MPKFLSNIDLNDNEIQNVRLHNLGTDPAYGGLTLAQKNALKGEVIYNTQTDKIKFWDGGNWVELGASSGGGGTFDDFTIADDNTPTPRTTLIADGNTFTIAGGDGISSVVTQDSDIVTISGTDATDTLKGIAKFNASDFTVTNGDVTIKNSGVATGQIADDAVTYSKIQNVVTANRVLGSTTANGVVSELQVTTDMIANGTITDQDISGTAAIADTKLNTISTGNKVSLTALDIDGATDIGAALASNDLIIVDDGASGTNRKSTIGRLGTLLQGTGLGLSGATLSVNYGTSSTTALRGDTAVDNVSVGNLKTALGGTLGNYTIGANTDAGTVAGNFTISGNLTVNGTTTSVNSNEVNIGDSFILLNSDATGTPADSQDAGIEIERGDSTNVSLRWDELEDDWEFQAFNHAATPVLTTYKISRTFTATIGGATQSIVNHNLGTRNIIVQLFDTSSYETVYAEVTRDTTNRILVDFAVAPTANDVTVLITTV